MTKRVVVLAADDTVRTALAQWLAEAGLEVGATDRGSEAAAFMEEGGADVVFLDRIYPHWSGFGTVQAIKQRHPGVRVVVAGTPPDDPWLPLARAVGADAVMPAPLNRIRVLDYV